VAIFLGKDANHGLGRGDYFVTVLNRKYAQKY
jgi:hypothetical protein